jgi:hypothetical protein
VAGSLSLLWCTSPSSSGASLVPAPGWPGTTSGEALSRHHHKEDSIAAIPFCGNRFSDAHQKEVGGGVVVHVVEGAGSAVVPVAGGRLLMVLQLDMWLGKHEA